jgi:hypothetical protein
MSLPNYDSWKADEPVRESEPAADPHEPCEREIARLEAAARSISFAELHALVAGWLPGQTFFVGVQVQHQHDEWGVRDIITWDISYSFVNNGCARIEAPTAAEAYAKLRAAVPAAATPLNEVGDLPW